MALTVFMEVKKKVNMEIKGEAKTNTDKIAKKCYEMIIEMYEKEYSEIIDLYGYSYFSNPFQRWFYFK